MKESRKATKELGRSIARRAESVDWIFMFSAENSADLLGYLWLSRRSTRSSQQIDAQKVSLPPPLPTLLSMSLVAERENAGKRIRRKLEASRLPKKEGEENFHLGTDGCVRDREPVE